MTKKKTNERCPLQVECGRKCAHEGHEIECEYYYANARPGYEIKDQEALRFERSDDELFEDEPMPGQLTYISVDKLHPHPHNPRKDVGDVSELADSIKANGVLQNLTVVPMELVDPDAAAKLGEGHYTVIIGHRRLAAAKLAGMKELPCVAVDMDARTQMQTMLIENMQRSDLTVYEQAQGFQMMLDLGATVEEIAEKSGFSTSTVRRRVKMMELDQKKLKEVSSRQLSLADFDTLAQIEDIKERNKCLDKIGTRDFDSGVAMAMRKQNAKKNRPLVKAWLKENGAVKIDTNDAYSPKYWGYGTTNTYASYIYIHDWEDAQKRLPKIVKGKQLYYVMDEDSIRLYQKAEKKKPEKKPAAVLAKEKAIREAWKALEDSRSVAYDLRKQFIEKLAVTSKNRTEILIGAIHAASLNAIEYNNPDMDSLYQLFHIDADAYGKKREDQFTAGLAKMQNGDLAKAVYALFGDDGKEGCTTTSYKRDFPEYQLDLKLNLIYNWLATIGYEMSSEEMALMNGEHEAYKAGDVYKAGGSK